MTYCFDIDGTICSDTNGDYTNAQPCIEAVIAINKLHDEGHRIKFFTARGSSTGKDWCALTKRQLEDWGVRYHELIFGKPEADIFIDDKAVSAKDWLQQIRDSGRS